MEGALRKEPGTTTPAAGDRGGHHLDSRIDPAADYFQTVARRMLITVSTPIEGSTHEATCSFLRLIRAMTMIAMRTAC
ncbi:hypothetical protein [Microbacterium jiangjiandongii]|uniref:hypothetical protein n=1 Tax=Microbacterium jiangjiandongii TaxID=3049071 RepID=UPI00214B11A0|nr:hypothetical protein [Microbacterium sp. zg.Y625]